MEYSFTSFRSDCEKVLDHVQRELSTLRTGRASASMLDSVTVDAYGQPMRIVELASITTPDPSLLVISPWDKSLLGAIEKAIMASGLSLQPVVDGEIVRIAVPALTEDRRKEMVKQLHKNIEQGRVMLRTARTDTKKAIESLKDSDGISEDDIASTLEDMESELKVFMDKLDDLAKRKETDLMTV